MEATIGSRLKAWRHALGLTQSEFAQRCGMHIGVLKKYEQDVNVPGGEVLAAIARTGVNMTWLLTGEGEMRPQASVGADTALKRESPYARRWEKIIALVEGIEDEAKRAAVLDELFTHAQKEAELDALRKAVAALQAQQKKPA